MPDKTDDENIYAILDYATLEYAKIQQEIDNLPKEKVPEPVLRPGGGKDFSEQINKGQFDALKERQEDVKQRVIAKAKQLSENKSPEEREIINTKVEEWNNKDPYIRYQELLELKQNPVALSEPKILKLLSDNKIKEEKTESKKIFSMSAKWEQSLGYKSLNDLKEESKQDISKTQTPETYALIKNDIIKPVKTISMSAQWEQSLGYTKDQDDDSIEPGQTVNPPEVNLDKE